MTFDRVREFVVRCRKRMGNKGCKECGKVLPNGLFLRGTPSLSTLMRQGFGPEALKVSMRSRGWYCRGCVNKIRELGTAAAATTTTSTIRERDQFATQEEWFDFLFKREYPDGVDGILDSE
ncbi:hypothetical protein LCGC14_0963390 [marine sediment metagenome]|uniref:Uncharacterized protein n=1 Tax=marine sediment metagenome TaxID=412755 RepID=A0A0F9NDV7_9ZZZZ